MPGTMQEDFSEEVRFKMRPEGLAGIKEYMEGGGRKFHAENMQRPRGKKRWSCPRLKRSS